MKKEQDQLGDVFNYDVGWFQCFEVVKYDGWSTIMYKGVLIFL